VMMLSIGGQGGGLEGEVVRCQTHDQKAVGSTPGGSLSSGYYLDG